ncbi:hypothetical protein BGZ75_008750 [Mortierella antarctica]|nr:hypothetical protein BGZ75_008750 [Mortierella antarctica]
MVAMERDLVIGLDAEQDRLERLRKRSSRREAVVRKADASLRAEDDRQSSRREGGSGTSFQSQDQGPHLDENVDQPPDTGQKTTVWARLWSKVNRDPALTQSERDFTEAWRATVSGRDSRRDRSAESAHSRAPSSLRFQAYQDEDESMLPIDISYVEYLSHELEVFDRAEAAGLQVFIATHPTLDVGPREEVCLIFFFIFALREIAQELLRLCRHVEKLEEQQKEEMERRGQSKPKKRLWWPKVMGNFWLWIAWGSNSQAQASEGYAGMVMNSVKNLEKNQPGLVVEEKSRVEVKAARETRLAAEKLAADKLAAENAARQEPAETSLRSLRRRATVLWDGPKSRRSKSITASFWKRPPTHDLERGVGENSLPPAEATTAPPAGQESAEKKKQPPPLVPKTIFVNVSKPKTLRYRFWEYLQVFQSDEVRYGFKMALALTFVGLWAWLEITGMLRAADRGQWTMMTIMAVLSPTIGATFSVCAIRIGGTLVGTSWALITYLIYPDDPFVTSAMLVIIAFVGVFLILESKHPLMGVIMVLSFSSVSFAKYHQWTNETIYEICYKQVVNITLGIILSVILNTFLWPVLARRELRKEIAQLIGRQGVLFAEIMNRFMLQDPGQAVENERYGPQSPQESSEHFDETAIYEAKTGLGEEPGLSIEPATVEMKEGSTFGETSGAGVGAMRPLHDSGLEPGDTMPNYGRSATTKGRQCQDDGASLRRRATLDADRIAFQHVEHQLQTRLLKITQLLELSRSEPRLKETFPEKLYKQIVQCCQNILDRIVSMRMAAQLLSPEVRDLIIGPMNYYRRDLRHQFIPSGQNCPASVPALGETRPFESRY